MPPRKRQGNPEAGYYPLPTESAPPRDLGTGMRLTTDNRNYVATLVAAENDLPENHLALLLQNAACLTCGEEYPGTGTEHWIAWNAESGMWESRDAAHQGNWII